MVGRSVQLTTKMNFCQGGDTTLLLRLLGLLCAGDDAARLPEGVRGVTVFVVLGLNTACT
jgi:hypothetical protein